MSDHVFEFVGPSDSQLAGAVASDVTAIGGAVSPAVRRVFTLSNVSALEDLTGFLRTLGWIPAANSSLPIQIMQSSHARLTSDASAINQAAGWVSVIERSVVSSGGTKLRVHASMIAAVTLGGEMRVLINGGSYSDDAICDTASLPILSAASSAWTGTVDLSSAATYTVKMQARAPVLASSVTPQMGCALELDELNG